MVSHLIMRVRWQIILPIVGLILFSAESFHSLQLNRQLRTSPQKYYYWALLSALPAFVLGALIVHALAHLGVRELLSFIVAMPFLVFGWFYFVGRLIDYRIAKRFRRSVA